MEKNKVIIATLNAYWGLALDDIAGGISISYSVQQTSRKKKKHYPKAFKWRKIKI